MRGGMRGGGVICDDYRFFVRIFHSSGDVPPPLRIGRTREGSGFTRQ